MTTFRSISNSFLPDVSDPWQRVPTANEVRPGTIVSPRRNHLKGSEFLPVQPNYPSKSPRNDPDLQKEIFNSTRPFKLKRKLAEGSYGVVYQAVYCELNNPHDFNDVRETDEKLAVKIMTNQNGVTSITGSSIGPPIEMDIMSRLIHKHLIKMTDITIVDFVSRTSTDYGNHPRTTIAISMPLAIGNLEDYMRDDTRSLSLPQKIIYLKQILSALDYLHAEQMLHLDNKYFSHE